MKNTGCVALRFEGELCFETNIESLQKAILWLSLRYFSEAAATCALKCPKETHRSMSAFKDDDHLPCLEESDSHVITSTAKRAAAALKGQTTTKEEKG
jgi:hypothetical protein